MSISRNKPSFFSEIEKQVLGEWCQLDNSPVLAAPWHQLFKQVQSPRHVLSELLQNAEDVGATWARCNIIDDLFVFEHNGQDFDEVSLASLCRFGYSSKRTLHTIGFRGIGFKTTFSLGPVVTVTTPSLSFRFSRQRFTLPVWVEAPDLDFTRVSVNIDNAETRTAVEQNLDEWLLSPIPILFFKNLQFLEINGRQIVKKTLGLGPVPRSEWFSLEGHTSVKLLKVTSAEEEVPEGAVEEIRRERYDSAFTPGACSVDIVFGTTQNRLYTVLPTQVIPNLPFSCNAPFVQEPSRVKIQDPAQSPTNRWLLQRIGSLVSDTLIQWSSNKEQPISSRVSAYELLPHINDLPSVTLDRAVRDIVCGAVKAKLKDHPLIVGHDGNLYSGAECADIPSAFLNIWGDEIAIRLLGDGKEAAVNRAITTENRVKLAGWEFLIGSDEAKLKAKLQSFTSLPRPESEDNLVLLWATVEQLLNNDSWATYGGLKYAVVPVIGSKLLYRPGDVFRNLVQDDNSAAEDYQFLCQQVLIAEKTFLDRVSSLLSNPTVSASENAMVQLAGKLYQRIRFDTASMQRVFEIACRNVFNRSTEIAVRLRLTKIAIMADLSVNETQLQYLCCDDKWRDAKSGLIYQTGEYDDLLPEIWLIDHAISSDYRRLLPDDKRLRLDHWLHSPKSGLLGFPAPDRMVKELRSQGTVRDEVRKRRGTGPDFYGASNTREFSFYDLDWHSILVDYWQTLYKDEPDIWVRVVTACAHEWGVDATKYSISKIDRPRGAARYSVSENLTPSWLMRLRSLPCLPEDRLGKPQFPHNLLYRTPETEPVLNIEQFVARNLDNSQTRPLLNLLGVRDKPQTADKLMKRLQALAEVDKPPLTHVLDLYRALDGVFDSLDTSARSAVLSDFIANALILDQDREWRKRDHVYQSNDNELPGVAVIHNEMRQLSLWNRINVPHEPTDALILDWLRSLVSRSEIPSSDKRHVSAVLSRMPQRSLQASEHWLSRGGTWAPWSELHYYAPPRGKEPIGDTALFDRIRRQTADFTMLTQSQVETICGTLIPLQNALMPQVQVTNVHEVDTPEWVQALAFGILRAQPSFDEDITDPETIHLEDSLQAISLHTTRFQVADSLSVVPFIDGMQVGTPSERRALWQEATIFTVGTEHYHHRDLVDELERRFTLRDYRRSIADCVGRPADWINGYFEQHFDLRTRAEAEHDLGINNDFANEASFEIVDAAVSVSDADDATDDVDDAIQDTDSVGEADLPVTNPSTEPHVDDHEFITVRRHSQRQNPLSVYLERQGFIWSDTLRLFRHPNGSTVRKETGSPFFMERDANGDELRQYWESASPFVDEIVIPADVWNYFELAAERCSIVAPGKNGSPELIAATTILQWKNEHRLTIAAASYRVKFAIGIEVYNY